MKKNIPFIAVYVLAFVVTVINIVYSIKGSVFSDINDLPEGEYVTTVQNPYNENKINVYKVENRLGTAIRCELERKNKVNNVFWQTGIDDVETVWVSRKVVNINGVPIDVVDGGFYDCRRGISLFQEGAIEGGEVSGNEQK